MDAEPNQEAAEQNKTKEHPAVVSTQTTVGQKLGAEKPGAKAEESANPVRPYFWTPIFRWIRRDSTATDWIIALFTVVIATVGTGAALASPAEPKVPRLRRTFASRSSRCV